MEFTGEQQNVLAHPAEKHGRVLAGPGTGKSATIIGLIERILHDNPNASVRLITFTRAATAELAQKVAEHSHLALTAPSTVHSFALSALLLNSDASGLPKPLRIADDWEMKKIVRPSLARRLGTTPTNIDHLFKELAANWESLDPKETANVPPEVRAKFNGGWGEHRRVFGYTLLQELPYAFLQLLREHEDVRGIACDLLVVDEYQDLNACDLAVLKILSDRGTALLAVGDDDQSIYGFRKAHPEGILRFLEEYPGAQDYPLSETHRCGQAAVDWACHVLEGDPDRVAHKPRLRPSIHAPNTEVAFLSFVGHAAEAKGVAELVQSIVTKEGVAPSDILILLRSDSQARFSGPIAAHLASLGIGVSDPDAIKRLLAEETPRLFLALARLLAAPKDSLAWATLLTLEPGVGASFLDRVYERGRMAGQVFSDAILASANDGFQDAPAASRGKIAALVTRVQQWLAAIEVPVERPEGGWGHWLADTARWPVNMNMPIALADLIRSVDSDVSDDGGLARFLGQIEPIGKDQARATSTGVRIMTLAASKGLTAEAVILPALEEGVIPLGDADQAEERRLLFVGLTRARRYLFATWAQRRTGQTARVGTERVRERRNTSPLVRGGPVQTQSGRDFLQNRWPGRG